MTSRWLLTLRWALPVAALGALHALGAAELATPPPRAWAGWPESVGTAAAVVAVLRLIALACAWYLLGLTIVGLVLRALTGQRSRAIERLVPRLVRPVLSSVLGFTFVAAPLMGWGRPPGAGAAGGPHSEGPASGPEAGEVPDPVVADEQPETVTMSRFRLELAPLRTSVETSEAWTVQTGDHFWSIARETLEDHWGREPSIAEIDIYWRALVEANRRVLAAPSNPDLLYPGQVLELPEPGGGGARDATGVYLR